MSAARASRLWAAPGASRLMLWPLAALFGALTALRRQLYRCGVLSQSALPVPTIVVGNIAVGGTGKTPLVIALAKALKQRGFHPGVLSRGYRGSYSKNASAALVDSDDAARFGDEIVLIHRHAAVPCAVGRARIAAGRLLVSSHPEIDVLLLDDGLQHYALKRDVELAVFDQRGVGNGYLMPLGPLREPPSRLAKVDAIVINSNLDRASSISALIAPEVPCFAMRLVSQEAWQLNHPSERRALSAFAGASLAACAGIGNPARFFAMLEAAGLPVRGIALADHARADPALLREVRESFILITEKDAVKWGGINDDRIWVVPVEASIDASLLDLVLGKLHVPR